EHLSGELPRAMIPSYFMRLPALPVTPGGKLDRQALPAPGLKDRQHYQAPSNEWEEKLVAIWATILRLDKETISVTDSFFELGGHSLRAMTLVNKIQGELGVEITIGDVFDARNIVNLGQLLQTSAKSDYMGLKKAERREYYPLSTAQRRLYYLYELDRTTLTYNLPAVIRLEGPLDKEKLRRVMLELVRRHGSLQTSFEIVRDEPVQKISDIEDFGIEYFRSAPDAIDGVIRQFIRPFGLHRAPLFRAGLIETAPEVHYLMADMHHIVSDGTSIGLLINDFMALYNGATPPPLAFEYKDYAVWQQSAAYQRRIARQKEFWVNEFSEAISPLDIPVDFVRPATTEGDFLWFDLTPEETRRLRALADAEVATISMVILAVLKVLFSRMARQDDIVVGMAVAGREQYELEGLIGMFPVVLPLRTYPKTHMRFREFLSALKSAFLGVFDNQSYQYEELGRELKLERTSSRNPWFDVLYLYQNFETSELSLPDLKVSEYREQHIVAYEKLNLTVKENDEQIFCKLIYSKALFREETMERLVKYFRQVVAAVIRDPDVVLSGIQLMNADERQALLNQSGKISPLPRDKTFADLFEQQVKRTPKNPAVEHNGLILTYEELYAHSVKLASHLVRAGAGPGRNVCVFLPRGIELLVSMLAIFRTGAVYVPADVDFPSQRVKEIVADSASGIVITSLETVRMMNELKQVVPTIKEVICLDRLEDIRQANNLQMPRNADDLAYIIYTSGTTGKPKGVMIHQLGLINHLYGMIDILQIDGRDGIAQTASPCFDISVWQFLTALLTGGRTIIVDKDRVGDPSQMTDILQRCRITIFQTVPSVMAAFLEELPSGTDRSLPELRWMIPTGETLSASLVKKWYAIYPGIRLLNAYGPAEASDDIATFIVPPMEEGDHVVPVGKPVQNMRIYILDESLNLCAIGIKGEICTAGPGVGKGYWKDAEKTRKAFVPNPYLREGDGADYAVLYRSGDIGYYQPDGGIVFTGRQDEQVKIRGHRIELGEIESRLLGHENIREAKVLVKEGPGGQALVAYYVSGEMIVAGELEAYLAARLPHYMIPSYFIHLRAFPLTVNGKVDKRALPDIGIRTEDEYIAPRNSIDKKLAGIWAGLLQIPAETISMNANFFYVGGHSLNAITLLNRVCKEFHIHMPLKEFLQKATIRWQSDTIHSQLGQAYSEPMSGTTEILI
ncbi:MAG TPA: amino acid adenylation domain-containing protein, partial [Puia sp.]|nr:amino acid adenylation domain-containing protein [Puia sp.]